MIVGCAEQREAHRSRMMRFAIAHTSYKLNKRLVFQTLNAKHFQW
jgi:hypothetical protein